MPRGQTGRGWRRRGLLDASLGLVGGNALQPPTGFPSGLPGKDTAEGDTFGVGSGFRRIVFKAGLPSLRV